MPQTITVPVTDRTKWIKFGAIYAPSLSFNPDKKLFSGGSGILSGMTLMINTGPVPPQVTVAPGAFIQRGIIVDITAPQTLEFPPTPISYPLYLVAENVDEASASDVKIEFVTPAPAPESAILAEWLVAPVTSPAEPLRMSNCELRDAIGAVQALVIQRDRQVAIAGQTVFTLSPGKSYVQGANKIWVYRNGKKLDISNDYVETSTTSITIFMPAIAGDIFEFLIFKGAPPITSIALDDLTDVTTDLANAIKDTNVLRASLATAANPLATMADLPVSLKPLHYVGEELIPTGSSTPGTGSAVYLPTLPNGYLDVTVPAGKTYNVFILGWAYAMWSYDNAGACDFYVGEQIPPGPNGPPPLPGETDKGLGSDTGGCMMLIGSHSLGGYFIVYNTKVFIYRTVLGPGPVTARYRAKFFGASGNVGISSPLYIRSFVQEI